MPIVWFIVRDNQACCADSARRPNIVLIVADDLGYGEPGCYGGTQIPTPHLDALAAAGVRFTQGYVVSPYCAPSRAGLLTGRYPARIGFERNPVGAANADPETGLPLTEPTLADLLRRAGYVTGLVGKWHLGGTARFHPQRRGFDEFFGFLHEGHYYVPPPWTGVTTWLRRTALPDGSRGRWTSPDGREVWSTHLNSREPDYDADNPLLRNSQPVEEARHLTDAFTAEAESFILRHRQQPFFLYLAYNAVHSPLQADQRYVERAGSIADIQRRLFAAQTMQLDDGVGRLLETLRATGLEQETLVIFLSDNGGPTRELTSSNLPLRGEKGQLYEGGIRVPMMVRWSGQLPAGRVEQHPVLSLDLMETALAAAGIQAAANPAATQLPPRDGVDLLPLLSGQSSTAPHEQFFWRYGPQAALRQGDWKIVRPTVRPASAGSTTAAAAWELYHLADDPSERSNLAQQKPELVAQLSAQWQQLDRQLPSAAGAR